MSLSEQITTDMKTAMKAKDNATLSTLRLLRSAIKNKQIDLGHELTDEEVIAVIKAQAKQLKDSIESFTDGGREDLAEPTRLELETLKKYLPAEMSDEDLETIVKKVIEDSGATSKAEMGKVMGLAMKAVAGKADGNRVKEIVAKSLSVFVLSIGIMAVYSSAALAAIPVLESMEAVPIIEIGVRIIRVMILAFGIVFVNKILHGGFSYTVASSRDESHSSAMQDVMTGLYGTIAVALLFSVATVVLEII
jgi:uncharacterized protein